MEVDRNRIEGLKRYQRSFCQEGTNKGKRHERGEWKVLKDRGWYKIMGWYCKYCNKKLGEKVLK